MKSKFFFRTLLNEEKIYYLLSFPTISKLKKVRKLIDLYEIMDKKSKDCTRQVSMQYPVPNTGIIPFVCGYARHIQVSRYQSYPHKS